MWKDWSFVPDDAVVGMWDLFTWWSSKCPSIKEPLRDFLHPSFSDDEVENVIRHVGEKAKRAKLDLPSEGDVREEITASADV